MISLRTFRRSGLVVVSCAALLCLALSGCDEDPTENDENYTNLYITKISGDNQSERVGAQLPERLVVGVENMLGDEQQGIAVTFSTEDQGASVYPESAVTDESGRASCNFVLGSELGLQHVTAVIETDSTTFSADAQEFPCNEADPTVSSDWSSDKIYFVTTSSTLLDGAGSVLVEFDPDTDECTEILETSHTLTDVSFSSRGELFVASSGLLYKVNATTKLLDEYTTDAWMSGHVELDANVGGILAGVSFNGPFGVQCKPASPWKLYPETSFITIKPENFCADPVSRALFFISGASPTYELSRSSWDGRIFVGSISHVASLNILDNTPRGMCIDYSGNIYITVNGSGNYRRIIKVRSGDIDDVDYEFFDFYDHFGSLEAGTWGDITLLAGSLYVIDTYENRLVEVATDGSFMREVPSTDFSRPGTSGETYGIAAKLQPPETTP